MVCHTMSYSKYIAVLRRGIFTLLAGTFLFPGSGLVYASSLEVSNAWARATPPGARSAAVYLSLASVSSADRLLGGSSSAAREVQIHTHIHDQGMMRMEQIESLLVEPGETINLRPGADHLMFIGLKQPLVAGQQIDLKLEFEHAGSVEISVPVRDAR